MQRRLKTCYKKGDPTEIGIFICTLFENYQIYMSYFTLVFDRWKINYILLNYYIKWKLYNFIKVAKKLAFIGPSFCTIVKNRFNFFY